MRRSKEIIVLLVLLAGMMGFVLWYVIDRRARLKAAPPVATQPGTGSAPVDLTKTDGQTIDFSSGKPVVKNSAADKAAMDAALKDIAEATKDVTFTAPKKPVAGTQTVPPKP